MESERIGFVEVKGTRKGTVSVVAVGDVPRGSRQRKDLPRWEKGEGTGCCCDSSKGKGKELPHSAIPKIPREGKGDLDRVNRSRGRGREVATRGWSSRGGAGSMGKRKGKVERRMPLEASSVGSTSETRVEGSVEGTREEERGIESRECD